MFGKNRDRFKEMAAKGMSAGITQGMRAVIEHFNLDEDEAMKVFMRAFSQTLARDVGEEDNFFINKNKRLKEILGDQ